MRGNGSLRVAAALVIAGWPLSLPAQLTGTVAFRAASAIQQVRRQGLTEALGGVQLEALPNQAAVAYATVTNAGASAQTLALSLTLVNAPITNAALEPTPASAACTAGTTITNAAPLVLASPGIRVTFRNLFCSASTTTISWNVAQLTATGRVLNITFRMAPGAVLTFGDPAVPTLGAPTAIETHGLRASVRTIPAGGAVAAFVNSAPSNVVLLSGFFNPLTVATVHPGLTVEVRPRDVHPNCLIGTVPVLPTFTTFADGSANSFGFRVTEGFVNAFTTQDEETGRSGPEVKNGTWIQIDVRGIPPQVRLGVPQKVQGLASDGVTPVLELTLILAGSPLASCAAPGACAGVSQLVPPGAGHAVQYAVTFSAPALGTPSSAVVTFNLYQSGLADPAAISAEVKLAPVSAVSMQSATAPIVRFEDQSFPPPGASIAIPSCITDILYPFVTNRDGFDTGIAISNTGQDHLRTSAQAGNCTLRFWNGSTTGATPAKSVVLPSLSAGESITILVSDPVNGLPGFQGYAIATCNFQFAHGLGLVVNGFQQSAAPTIGTAYLGLVFQEPRGVGAHAPGAPSTVESLSQ